MKHVSSKDVAKLAGVSQITVSRVFNNKYKGYIKEETKEKVLKAAQELNYVPNRLANFIRTNKTDLIGLVLPKGNYATYNEYLTRFIEEFAPEKQIISFPVNPLQDADSEAMKLASFNVEAIILLTVTISRECAELLKKKDIVTVVINRKIQGFDTNYIISNYYKAGRDVADYFKKNNSKELCLVRGNKSDFYEPDRERGFLDYCDENDMKIVLDLSGDYSYRLNSEYIQEIRDHISILDGIFCVSDNMAYYVLDSIRDLESKVQLVGFDNNAPSRFKGYNLTTVAVPYEKVVKLTYETILNQIDEPSTEYFDYIINLDLVTR